MTRVGRRSLGGDSFWERAFLAGALGAALVLATMALGPLGDPKLAGAQSLVRVAKGWARDARGEWRRMQIDGGMTRLVRERLEWPEDLELFSGRAEGRELRADDVGGAPEFVVLFASARWRELEQRDHRGAYRLLAGALELPGLSTEQRELAALRSVQLAARIGAEALVREAWEGGARDIDGGSVVNAIPALLLAAFTAAPYLDGERRSALRADLEARWAAGELALPGGDGRLVRVEGSGRIELPFELLALRDELRTLAPDRQESLEFSSWLLSAKLDALSTAIGELPVPIAGEGVRLRMTPAGPWLTARASGGLLRAGFVELGDCARELESRMRKAGLLPDGARMDFEGGDDSLGEAFAERVPLWGTELGFVARHPDPDSLVRTERRRALVLRVGLLAVALLAAAAGGLGFVALRRERRLRELKSTFVAAVSHELRTPLASILLMAENLEGGRVADAATQRKYHGLLRKQALRLRRLVDDVLDVSRLERGRRLHLQVEEVELGDFARELCEEVRERAADDRAKLQLDLGALPERGLLDAAALRRAVWNLVENALKHGKRPDRDRSEIELAIVHELDRLSVSVRDHGPGIPARARERVFRAFERLDERDASPGTGLGLAIAREIARAHGGELLAGAPADGEGALMTLTIPLESVSPAGERKQRGVA